LSSLKSHKNKIDIKISSKKDKWEDRIIHYKNAQIIDLSETEFSIRVFMQSAQGVVNNIPIKQIEEIDVLNAKHDIIVHSENIGQFDMLDID